MFWGPGYYVLKTTPLVVAGIVCMMLVLGWNGGVRVCAGEDNGTGLTLSDIEVRISAGGHTAAFRLYDTVAAREFYRQLPLTLALSNFRDAQWMFYPPEKLNVTDREAYHDGKKGELSYYAPWGDVFMLYKDFHAGDEMHRLGVGIFGIDEIVSMLGNAVIERNEPTSAGGASDMYIEVIANGSSTVFKLNDSPAAQALYSQLPLSIAVKDYGSNEKIFYPPKKLDVSNTPSANALAGTLAYYAPWGDVVMFYKQFGSASGLYELGEAVSGSEHIKRMSGTVEISKGTAP